MYGEEREEIAFSVQAVASLYNSGEVVPEENETGEEKFTGE